jgi:hypothetical protein
MDRALQEFEDTLITRNLVARVVEAKEFPSSDALKRYLDEHPKAKPSNHSVKDQKTPTKFRRDDKSRWNEALKATKDLKELGQKAKSGDPEAKAEVSKRLNTLAEHGTSIAADAIPLLKKLRGQGKLSDKAKELEAALGKFNKARAKSNKAKDSDAQLSSAAEILNAASDMRTLLHHLTDETEKASKRAADEWKA